MQGKAQKEKEPSEPSTVPKESNAYYKESSQEDMDLHSE